MAASVRRDDGRSDAGRLERMEKKDRVTAAQAETAPELDALLPAILDPAFKGES
jgi:hypothetical protein